MSNVEEDIRDAIAEKLELDGVEGTGVKLEVLIDKEVAKLMPKVLKMIKEKS